MASSLLTSLISAGHLTNAQAVEIAEYSRERHFSEVESITALRLFDADSLSHLIGHVFGLPVIDVLNAPLPVSDELILPDGIAVRDGILPLEDTKELLRIAVADPGDIQMKRDLQFSFGKRVELVIANHVHLRIALEKYHEIARYSSTNESSESVEGFLYRVRDSDTQQQDSVDQYLNQIVRESLKMKASDIHIEPTEENYRIRIRCDGVLTETQVPGRELASRLSSRIKVLAGLNIAERRLPQDGQLKLSLSGYQEQVADMRVSTLPVLWGEKTVLRIQQGDSPSVNVRELGLSEEQKDIFTTVLSQPQGLILVTGPTGSGKTITLYSCLKHLNTVEKNIATAEDPIEITLPGINQVQINNKTGLNFVTTLKALLRQDPDIIMIGEIRDAESADIAIKAAQTGHLVLSTLHTNSAAETIGRLINMGVNRFDLASCLTLVVAQRLCRKLCLNCRIPDTDALPRNALNLKSSDVIYKASSTGCDKCTNGYSGRVGAFEVLRVDPTLARLIEEKSPAVQIEAEARGKGFASLSETGLDYLLKGITSYQELKRTMVCTDYE